MNCCGWLDLSGYFVWHMYMVDAGAMKTVARVDNLAQANLPRLGKMSKHSPRTFHASGRSSDQLSFERVSVMLRRGESRLSENA